MPRSQCPGEPCAAAAGLQKREDRRSGKRSTATRAACPPARRFLFGAVLAMLPAEWPLPMRTTAPRSSGGTAGGSPPAGGESVVHDIDSLPESLRTLVDRFDASVFDAPRWGAHPPGRRRGWAVGRARRRRGAASRAAAQRVVPDATLTADRATWEQIAADLRGGMDAYRAGRLVIRHNLHLGVGFLAATSGRHRRPSACASSASRRASGASVDSDAPGPASRSLLIHGLGATKGSFLPTVAALAGSFRTIALDLPGFGDSYKPLARRYHAPFFARAVVDLLDALGTAARPHDRQQHGRARRARARPAPSRARRTAGAAGAVARLATRAAVGAARARAAPGARPGADHAALGRRGDRAPHHSRRREQLGARRRRRVPARLSDAARARRLLRRGAPDLSRGAARREGLLDPPRDARSRRRCSSGASRTGWCPIGFAAHVQRTLPSARHLELDCGHVPQLERPAETHAAIAAFLREAARR